MTDRIVSTSPWTPPGGLVALMQPGDRLVAPTFGTGDGQRAVVLIDNPFDTVGRTNLDFDETIELRANAPMTGGVLQIRSDGVRVNCEVNSAGKASQGVQVFQWKGTPATPPSGLNFDRAFVHDIADDPTDQDNGKNHAFYMQDCGGATGLDVRVAHVPKGAAVQCDPSDGVGVCTGVMFERMDALDVWQLAFFWGNAHGNALAKVYCPATTPNRGQFHPSEYPWVQGGGAAGNACDYVVTPTVGYGARTAPPIDVAATASAIEAHLKATTISYPQWAKNVAAHKYPDPAATHWGAAFAGLETLKGVT